MTSLRSRPRTSRPLPPAAAARRWPYGARRLGHLVAVCLAVLATVAAVALAAGSRGVAATKQAQAEPTPTEQFAMTPTGADPTQPGSRTSFSFHLAPGGQAADRVTLFNYADHATAFQIYANDALDTAEGQLDLKRFDQNPTDAGSWVKLEQAAVVVPASSAVVVPFVVIVPKGASPGDHGAGILAAIRGSTTTATGERVAVEHRVGVPLYVRVAGPLHPRLAVVGIQSHYHHALLALGGGSLDISYRVVNVGNVRLAGHQQVSVEGPLGWVLKRHAQADIPELLPGGSVSGRLHLTDVLPAVRVSSDVTVRPFSKQGALRPPPPTASASSSVWAVPWVLLFILALIVGWGIHRYRRHRRTRGPAAARPAPAASSPASSGVSADGDAVEVAGSSVDG